MFIVYLQGKNIENLVWWEKVNIVVVGVILGVGIGVFFFVLLVFVDFLVSFI